MKNLLPTSSRLAVKFAGLNLSSPIIAASAPPTESAEAMLSCAKAGAGAVVTKSILDYDRADWPNIPRRVKRDQKRLWIQGSFASETLTLAEGESMIADTRAASDIPIIASVGVLDPTCDASIETAARLVAAGADLIHFDLFYLSQPRCDDEMIEALVGLFALARAEISVNFGPKLNTDIPAHRFATAFDPATIDCVFLLDSIRVPPPLKPNGAPRISAWNGGLECSLFGGDWQKPITLQYARVLSDAGMPELCVGGGLRGGLDIVEAAMLGATTIQVATQLIIQGYDWISRTNEHLEQLLETYGVAEFADLRGLGLRVRDRNEPESVTPVRAVVDEEKCDPCGVCTKLAFCPFIDEQTSGVPIISDACYGCGLCEEFCPQPGAIRMEAI